MTLRLPEITRWMFDEALPLWARAGQDRPGLGFVELLAADGRPLDPGFKRIRVQARQIYTFCHAAELGWNRATALGAAKNGMEFILQHAWLPEGGWAERLNPAGERITNTLYAYEQAFVLFALGWYYRLTGDAALIGWAYKTLDVMHQRLAHPKGFGFLTHSDGAAAMEQDPQMHFLEAMLVWYKATGEARFAEEARTILRLFEQHIHQAHSAVLLEDFDLDWQSPADPDHRRVEPGHHFEWIWLLWQAKLILGDDLMPLVPPLFAFADRHGCGAEGLVYDDVLEDGRVLNPTHRTWVQTEALKGYITMSEYFGQNHDARIAEMVSLILDRYLAAPVRGTWTDQPLGVVPGAPCPASTLYHLFLAFAELQRWAKITRPSGSA
jgi:N-acylglucosamine 2-epimerase/mannose-6-phosphate isomerase